MGAASSKSERSEALRLCKERKRFIKQAVDSRYALAAAHVSYVESLRNIGIALRRYAEAEVLIASSLSTSATELDKTPSHSSYPSPSASHIGGVSDSPILNGSPLSPPPIATRLSYMRSARPNAVTVKVSPHSTNMYVDDVDYSTPLPPPPPPDSGSWDFFDPTDNESFRFVTHNGRQLNFDELVEKDNDGDNGIQEEFLTPKSEPRSNGHGKSEFHDSSLVMPKRAENNSQKVGDGEAKDVSSEQEANGSVGTTIGKSALQVSGSKGDKSLVDEREDPSEFITHRAKDFLSSIKDIEHRFFRASESGKEISRMLEASKIRVGYSEAKGKSSVSAYLSSMGSGCCSRAGENMSEADHVTKVIIWKRTTSSRSSSSRNPLNGKDDNDDSGSDFVEDFCMIAGSHSSTLDRVYAWERKLYDEVKTIESIRRDYDRKCNQLRHQFAKDVSTQIIDKTRSVVKDLHSRIRVALYSVDSISKRIEKMRDEELLPQILELIQGLIRMWRAMLECHHAQYITISLAYHAKASASSPQGDTQKLIMSQLQDEVECFGLSFANWINSHTSYVEALNSWLQNCILQPRERTKGRRAFSPRRVLAPPIFVLCRDWSTGIKSLPSEELSDAIKDFLYDLRHSVRHHSEELQKKETTPEPGNEELEAKDEEKIDEKSSNLNCIHSSLTRVLDRLTKFSEASLKMCEDIRQKCDTARNAYLNYRPAPRSFSI
ncbi:protein ALTERED PHOSPHATE STARVATION RESPONSE 1 isoform X2 [Solanum dulcamara]|uniref:protein ALTERED PHOSPHATE STARVATION RESPONSE 1 isoform X2 n=1 Tax=Solanum dulcamara TaxID=45834 RepID=UPI0024858007|nr:protein ALTERED PHOSPHATE STARVATION RESPONSE 1 isoform X2 [Solanum dulcamara]